VGLYMTDSSSGDSVAVMTSGGLDSAILVAELACAEHRLRYVTPIYVRCGLFWEEAEERALRQFLAALPTCRLAKLKVFDLPLRDVYGDHWSATGEATPGKDTPDEAVYLPGRNLLLLAQAAVWCGLNGIETIALGHLGANPFADGTPEFFELYAAAINRGLQSRLRISQPYRELTKVEVLRRGRTFPLELTWSCLRPKDGRHCGQCNKCAERKRAFAEAGLPDPTRYAQGSGA
jgi:7-cyano-7-deazaguanine synthase